MVFNPSLIIGSSNFCRSKDEPEYCFFFYGFVYSWKPPASVKTLTLTKKEHDIRIPELLVHRYFDFGFTCKETSRGTEISAC